MRRTAAVEWLHDPSLHEIQCVEPALIIQKADNDIVTCNHFRMLERLSDGDFSDSLD